MFVLKQLRRKKKINQTDLAKAIGVSLRTIQLYEKKNANIPIKNLTKIADYFGVTIAELYSHEVNEDGSIYDIKLQSSQYSVKSLGNKKRILTIPLVTAENYSVYFKEFQNQEFLSNLPVLSFMIEDVVEGNYIAFENVGNSMENGNADSVPNGAIVLGKEISLKNFKFPNKGKNDKAIVIYEKGILCKEIIGYDEKNKTIICHSLNTSPEYADFEVPIAKIKQAFKVIKKQTD